MQKIRNCPVPIRSSLATCSREQFTTCGKDAVLIVKWTLRRTGKEYQMVDVAVCYDHAVSCATKKFPETQALDLYTRDEIKLLAQRGMYVDGAVSGTIMARAKNSVKSLFRKPPSRLGEIPKI